MKITHQIHNDEEALREIVANLYLAKSVLIYSPTLADLILTEKQLHQGLQGRRPDLIWIRGVVPWEWLYLFVGQLKKDGQIIVTQ